MGVGEKEFERKVIVSMASVLLFFLSDATGLMMWKGSVRINPSPDAMKRISSETVLTS